MSYEALLYSKLSGPQIRDSSLSVIPEVIYVITGEEDETQKTKPFAGVQSEGGAGSAGGGTDRRQIVYR